MYRIWCKFYPQAKRANGGTKKGPKQERAGAWCVFACHETTADAPPIVRDSFAGTLGVLCDKPRRVGTRVSPWRLHSDMIERRSIARQLMRAYGAAA